MTKYVAISSDEALRYLKQRDDGEAPDLSEFQKVVGKGEEYVPVGDISKLVSELKKLKGKFPKKLRHRDQEGGHFEQLACEIVHRCLKDCPREILADMDFWTWLAVAKLADLIEWRYAATVRAKVENYGIGKRGENLIFRLWLRAELGKLEKGSDPYRLAKTGDQDLWRSHIIRQGYANARLVTKALLRLQAGQLKAKRLGIEGVRLLAKRLRRLRANVVFEYLTAMQAETLVLELSADLKSAK